jgi:hypothetical protein
MRTYNGTAARLRALADHLDAGGDPDEVRVKVEGDAEMVIVHEDEPKVDPRLPRSAIPKDWPVQPLAPRQWVNRTDRPGATTCGTCELTWDDAVVTSMTPAPSARCPFEPFHSEAPRPRARKAP